ncbi:hypothetical protein [Deinococcus planocerae]|uniref:hypothetical protein n=1 Tax=Deinococcus planocerae TaxID=1737569 RepID=UPI000C7F0D2E|nr:hypothetical protein [Deinococcus planocerae]
MLPEIIVAPLLTIIASFVFRRFARGVPVWKRAAKWAVYLGVGGLVTLQVGRPWSLVWIWGVPALAVALHVFGCARLGLHPLTAEPRTWRREAGGEDRPKAGS